MSLRMHLGGVDIADPMLKADTHQVADTIDTRQSQLRKGGQSGSNSQLLFWMR